MNVKFQWVNAARQMQNKPKRYNVLRIVNRMACFCGCETYEKNEDGYKIACVKCGHGPQNHDEEFRAAARENESASQKRDSDFG